MDFGLTRTDYEYLYPFLSPEEIKREYGKYSKTARHIQSLYKANGWLAVREAKNLIIQRSYAIAPLEIDENRWLHTICEELAKESDFRKNVVWSRLKQVMEMYV